MTRHNSIYYYWQFWAAMIYLALMIVMACAATNAVRVTLTPIPYKANVTVMVTDPDKLVAGFNVFCGTNKIAVAGRTNVSLTISNLTGPGGYTLTAQAVSFAGALSAMSDEYDLSLPVQTMKLGCPTNYFVQWSADAAGKSSWISVPSMTITNSRQSCFYRATTNWP